MTKSRLLIVGIAAALALGGCQPPAYDLAITSVTAVDAEQGARPNVTVLTTADTIAAIVPAASAFHADRVVDGTGLFLIPGLWDMHVHLTYDGADADEMARLFLDWGVTSVRDTGGLLDEILPVVERLKASPEAPRVFFAGPLLDGQDVVYGGVDRPEIGVPNPDPETAAARVAALAEAGVDFVKVYEMVQPEVFRAIVAAARIHDLPVAGHIPLSMMADTAGPDLDSMEHLRNVEMACASNFEELLYARRDALENRQAASGADLRSSLHSRQRLPAISAFGAERCANVIASLRETIQVPTLRLNALTVLSPFERADWEAALSHLGQDQAGELRSAGENWTGSREPVDGTFGRWSLHLTALMNEAGVPVGAGTDTPIGFAIPGYSLHNELDMLARAGLEPPDILAAATRRPPEFFGLDHQMGLVREGMRADLVLIGGNPLEDIAHTRDVRVVIARGRVVRESP